MAKNVIFFVHGMGQHREGWTSADNGPIPTLSKVAEYYSYFSADDPLSNSVEFVEIRYDDIFDKILSRWSELSKAIKDKLPEATPGEITKVANELADADDPDNWFAAQAMDVLFYWKFKLVRRLIQLRVASQIMRTVASHYDDNSENRKYIVVAHSLGTAVAHDAIHQMGTARWLSNADRTLAAMNDHAVGAPVSGDDLQRVRQRYGDNPFAPGLFKFEAIFMISNTSVLLHKVARNPYESIVRPSNAAGPLTNACLNFYNVDHLFDPISKVRRFRAEEAWPTAAERGTAKDIFDVRHIHDVDIHGLEHYLVHPLVHRELLAAVAPHRFRQADYQTARERIQPDGDFPLWGEKYRDEDLQGDISRGLEKLQPRGDVKNLEKLVAILLALPKLIKDIKSRT